MIALLEHEEGWVRINAAKTLSWLDDRRAVKPIAAVLSKAKTEADYGYNGTFKNAKHDDPAPRWREAAKAWFKGHLPSEIEERTRTVRAVNLLAR